MQWVTLFQKEVLEHWRNYKLVWVPLVMILLAIMDPISTYYLPQIIESVGGLPGGAIIDIPSPAPNEVVLMSLGQLSSLGVLIIVLTSMTTVAGERKSGVSELILVKPVAYHNYITAKWATQLLIVWMSLIIAMTTSWYYINLLFGELSFLALIQIIFFYGLWLSLVTTIAIFYSSLIKTPGLAGFMSILTIMLMSLMTKIFGHILKWSPNKFTSYINDLLITNEVSGKLIATSITTVIFISGLLILSIYVFKTKELAN